MFYIVHYQNEMHVLLLARCSILGELNLEYDIGL